MTDRTQDPSAAAALGLQAPGSGNLPAAAPADAGMAVIGPDALAIWAQMAESVPEVGEDAWGSIIAQIASAETVEDLDKPWKTEGMEDLRDTVLVVTGIRRAPSDFESGLRQYLIVDATRTDTGEKITTTTGSTAIVLQLVRAHGLNAFPLRCIPRVATRKTKAGFLPMHLEIVPMARAR